RTSFNWVGLGFLPLIGAPTFWFQFRGATRESGGRLTGERLGFWKPPPIRGDGRRRNRARRTRSGPIDAPAARQLLKVLWTPFPGRWARWRRHGTNVAAVV